MKFVVFKTEDAVFKFKKKAVMECLENRKSSYNVQELDTLIQVLFNQPDQTILSSAEHPYFGFIALDLINAGEGYAFCKHCGKNYSSQGLKSFDVRPDKATFKAALAKKGEFKNLFRRKPKLPGMHGGKGYKCPRGHTLIHMITWKT